MIEPLVDCEQCNIGTMVLRHSRSSMDFYGCSNYPNCTATMSVAKFMRLADPAMDDWSEQAEQESYDRRGEGW